MQWYYSKSGSQHGPISQEVMRSKISSGEIYQSDLVWREGMVDWLTVARVPELAVVARPATSLIPLVAENGNTAQTADSIASARIPNYLWQSIVVTLCCCCPFLGIPAIIYAAKVDGLSAKGDLDGAMEASKNAKRWCYITVGAGLIVFAIVGTLVAMGKEWAAALSTP
jgi:hypothetical protein